MEIDADTPVYKDVGQRIDHLKRSQPGSRGA
jgi:hypothetical protein